ncbi:MAG: DNA-processing protein DprA [Coriobacteriia bacterium]|nr:DNA-processing protein DprA [Coriobacteriia bacterium]
MTDTFRRFEIEQDHEAYPACFFDVPEPPPVLYGIGNPDLLNPGLGVIGARKATPYGRRCARMFAGWAASHGQTVVSGAAIGCDQEAHLAALEAQGATVAVLGCGADVDYPRRAGALLRDVRRRGVVVSECPWGTPPQPWLFRKRNRLIAALSRVLLVVEASLPSGTFVTAEYALDAGREVCAVPGSILAPECRGSNRLIRQGATPVTDVSELALTLQADFQLCNPDYADSSRDELARALIANPMRPDDAARECELDIVETVRRISELELEGVIRKYPDGRYGSC